MDDTPEQLQRTRAALERLERALGRLETAVKVPDTDETLEAEALQQAREDYARLDDAARLVEARLDGVIGRLKNILGE